MGLAGIKTYSAMYYVQDCVRSWAAAYSSEGCLPVAKMESIYIRDICEIVVGDTLNMRN